jgi:hypothetical protein
MRSLEPNGAPALTRLRRLHDQVSVRPHHECSFSQKPCHFRDDRGVRQLMPLYGTSAARHIHED